MGILIAFNSAQVMGAPVAGSSLRATVVRGGGLRLKGLVPRYRSKKVQMIFPLTGSERRGLVSLEAKKQHVSSATFLVDESVPHHPTMYSNEERFLGSLHEQC